MWKKIKDNFATIIVFSCFSVLLVTDIIDLFTSETFNGPVFRLIMLQPVFMFFYYVNLQSQKLIKWYRERWTDLMQRHVSLSMAVARSGISLRDEDQTTPDVSNHTEKSR